MQSDGFLLLVRQAQAGDRQAAESLFAAARPYLEQIIQDYCGPSGGDASQSDLVQTAWLRAWERLGQFRGADTDADTLAAFKVWLRQILHTAVLNWERDEGRKRRSPDRPIVPLDVTVEEDSNRPAPDPQAVEPTPATQAAAAEEDRIIRHAIEQLDDLVARQIVWMRFRDELSLREIAQRLGLEYERVRKRFHETLERLEEKLNSILGPGSDA